MASCLCSRCVSLCLKVPGWPTPSEARAMICAGLAGKLMRDWWEPDDKLGNTERIYVLCPAVEGCEGQDAKEISVDHMFSFFTGGISLGRCVFLSRKNLCQIHDTTYKPVQCRGAYGCRKRDSNMLQKLPVAKMWRGKMGAMVLAEWKAALA